MSCVDIIVVRQPNGTLKSSPFFVRFSTKAFRTQLVRVYIDGVRFNPMNEEKQMVLEKDTQYAYFRTWAFVKKHHHLNSLRMKHLKRYQSKSTGTPVSPTSISSRAFSPSEYIRQSREFAKSLPALRTMINEDDERKKFGFYTPDFDERGHANISDDVLSTYRLSPSSSSSSPSVVSSPSSSDSIQITDTECKANAVVDEESTAAANDQQQSVEDKKQAPKSFFDNWLESIDNEAHSYDKVVPSSDYLEAMNLTKDVTKIVYELNGERIEGRIFLWHYTDKLVVSDVDGTITKSDLLGQIFSRLGKDYTHPGIPSLFTKIVHRGYKLIYLTARPITDGQMTRSYIENVKQGRYTMPTAPVITTPNSTWSALAREVIIRRPETYKIAILSFIKELFAENCFVAGWGNRPTDCLSYTTVGIHPDMSFRVNSRGEIVVHNSKTFFSSHQNFESKLDMLNLFPLIMQEVKSHLLPKDFKQEKKKEENTSKTVPPVQKEENILDLNFEENKLKASDVAAIVKEENESSNL